MKFLDRSAEMSRLDGLLANADGGLGVIYGRRRIGKTRLLLEWCRKHDGIYWVADESAASIQRGFCAGALAQRFEGFADVDYPGWDSLLSRFVKEAMIEQWRGPFVIDELPYAVAVSPELPSILQRWIDHDAPKAGLVIAVSGSSRHMMQGLALNASSPLYGRSKALFKVGPLPVQWLPKAFPGIGELDAVRYFTIWGGIPRYWELAEQHGGTLEEQVHDLALDPQGPLHSEPDRLLHDETPPAVSLRPILDAIGLGARRISEIAGRIGMPATSLSPHLSRLQELELISREIPFGESEKSSKRSIYALADPFFRAWFKIVAPNRGALSQGSKQLRVGLFRKHFPALVAMAWEQLCREAVPHLSPESERSNDRLVWGPAGRYWHKNGPEWDIVARSMDGNDLLIGECKWVDHACAKEDLRRWERELLHKGAPPIAGAAARAHYALFISSPPPGIERTETGVRIIDAKDILRPAGRRH